MVGTSAMSSLITTLMQLLPAPVWTPIHSGGFVIEMLPRETGVMAAFRWLVSVATSSELIAVISGCFDAWHSRVDWE